MILCVCPNPSIDSYAWLNEFYLGGVNRIDLLSEYPGGKGTHVAIAVQKLGVSSTLFANWAGNTGKKIQELATSFGLGCEGVNIKGENRKCFTFRSDNSRIQNTELLEPGPEISPKDFSAFCTEFQQHAEKAELICASGSWPNGSPDDAYAQLIRIAKQFNRKLVLDCSGVQLEQALEEKFFGLHINEHEAKTLFDSSDVEEIIRKLKSQVELIALTKGKEGLYLYYNNRLIHANVQIDHVLSTVGSGDCLTGGIAYAASQHLDIEEMARYGVSCGAANCLNEDLGIFNIQDVQKLYQQVTINQLNYV